MSLVGGDPAASGVYDVGSVPFILSLSTAGLLLRKPSSE